MRKTGVLLVNLGTPDSPKAKDVYRYLIEFLTDRRVIDKPWLIRQLLVRGLIVPFRYRQSSQSYQEIWLPEGSPLKVYSERVKTLLQASLGEKYLVELAMRYQNPSIQNALDHLLLQNIEHLIVIPLFPQYASATTGSIHEKILQILSKKEVVPRLSLINNFAKDPLYIQTVAEIASKYQIDHYDHVLFSFHGLPKRHVQKINTSCGLSKNCCERDCLEVKDCYAFQCHETAKSIVKELKIDPSKYSITFQSRLGKDPWLQPFTSDTIEKLAKEGKKRVLVFCPSFVSDCLETIHEIGVEYKLDFLKLGGEVLDFVESLNDHPKWIETLSKMVRDETNQ